MSNIQELRQSFTKEEFEQLKAIKEKTKLSWHDFLIQVIMEYGKAHEVA